MHGRHDMIRAAGRVATGRIAREVLLSLHGRHEICAVGRVVARRVTREQLPSAEHAWAGMTFVPLGGLQGKDC